MWCFCFLHSGLFLPLPPLSCAPSTFLQTCPVSPLHHSFPIRSAEASNKYQICKPTLYSVHPGDVLTLSCSPPATGTITWTKDGSSLGTNNRTLIKQDVLQIDHYLLLTNIQICHGTCVYSCALSIAGLDLS